MVPCLERLLDIKITIATIPSDWKRTTVFPVLQGDRSIDNHKLRISQLFSCLQASGTRHCGIPKPSLG